MNKDMLKNNLILLLAGIAIFSLFKYVSSARERHNLTHALNEAGLQIALLEKDKENLSQALNKKNISEKQAAAEVLALKGYSRAAKNRLTKLFAQRAQAQEKTEDLSSKFNLLKAENSALIKQRSKLHSQLAQVSQENDSLKTKLSSVTELKRIISALTKNKNKIYARANQQSETDKIVEGNRGFLIKNGKLTYPAKVKIEVTSVLTSK